MKYLLTLIALLLCLNSKAQDSGTFLLGKWNVIDVTMGKDQDPDMKKAMKLLKPGILKTVFVFEANNRGKFKMPMDIGTNIKTVPTEDIYWTYAAANKFVVIREWKKRNSTLIQFNVKKEGAHTYFIVGEYPDDKFTMVLKVVKKK